MSVDKAAALSTIGVPIEIDQTIDSRTGRGWKTILLGLEAIPSSRDLGGRIIEGADDEGEEPPAARHKTRQVLKMLSSGLLEKGDPHNPLLDALRACKAREALALWIKTGQAHHIAQIAGAHRTRLIPGAEPPSVQAIRAVWLTRNIKVASALVCLGCPIVRLVAEGPNQHAFYFPLQSRPLGEPAFSVPDLVQSYRVGKMGKESPNHPFLWMVQALENRERILDYMNKQERLILVRAPGTGRASLIKETQADDPRVIAHLARHLRISAPL